MSEPRRGASPVNRWGVRRTAARVPATLALLCATLSAMDAGAQSRDRPATPVRAANAPPVAANAPLLPLERTLTSGATPGCEGVRVDRQASRNRAESRRALVRAQEAALEGDRAIAREAYARAASLDPLDVRAAQELSRVAEELADTTTASSMACRVLALDAPADVAADASARVQRLLTSARRATVQRARARFAEGLTLADRANWEGAARAFADVEALMPGAFPPRYNRAVAQAMSGSRARARAVLSELAPQAPAGLRADIGRAITLLEAPVYDAGTAFAFGLVPGGGQFYTGRPAAGVLVAAAVGGAIAAAFVTREQIRTVEFLDPNGEPAPYTQTYRTRPYTGIAAAVGATALLVGAIEASIAARRSGRLPVLRPTATARGAGLSLTWAVPAVSGR